MQSILRLLKTCANVNIKTPQSQKETNFQHLPPSEQVMSASLTTFKLAFIVSLYMKSNNSVGTWKMTNNLSFVKDELQCCSNPIIMEESNGESWTELKKSSMRHLQVKLDAYPEVSYMVIRPCMQKIYLIYRYSNDRHASDLYFNDRKYRYPSYDLAKIW